MGADSKVQESRKKLDELASSEGKPADGAGSVAERGAVPHAALRTALWPDHAMGELVDAKAGAAAATKSSGVDLLVTGAIEIASGYATTTVKGYDRALDREVFSWQGACSVEDPAPLAEETAIRLERWIAGADYARLELRVSPASARVLIDGKDSGQDRVAYVFEAGRVVVEADADGYLPRRESLRLALGERRTVDIALTPLSLGTALVVVDPPGASVSVDSVPAGKAPISIVLDGTRGIVVASADGRESASVVLPASGEPTLELTLPAADELGPSGRVEAARSEFFKSLGWLVVAIPPTALSAGAYSLYSEAEARSPLESTAAARTVSGVVLAAAAAGTAAAAVNMIVHLVEYLGAAR